MTRLIGALKLLEVSVSWYNIGNVSGCTLQYKYHGHLIETFGSGVNIEEALFRAVSKLPKSIRNFL